MVFAGPPKKPATAVAKPSPIRVLCKPGSSIKFLSVVDEIAEISPICSIIAAIAIGAITRIEVKSNLAIVIFCKPIIFASLTAVKSIQPKIKATI